MEAALVPVATFGLGGGEERVEETTTPYLSGASERRKSIDEIFWLEAGVGVEYDAAQPFAVGMLLGVDYKHYWTGDDDTRDREIEHDFVLLLVELYVAFRSG